MAPELRLGGWGDVRDFVLLHLGDGIAAGIVVDGRLYRGASLNAGEVGHIIISDDGPVCYCGNRGCLESVAAPRAVVEACRHAATRGVRTLVLEEAGRAENINFEHIMRAAAKGDRLASNLLNDAGRLIGRVAADLINVFDPEVLMLGGILAGPRNELVETVERTVRSRVLPMLRDATRIEFSRLKESASMLGASVPVLDELFDDPQKLFGLPG